MRASILFSMRDPDETLQKASESAVRSVIGRTNMNTILSGSGSQLAIDTQTLLQAYPRQLPLRPAGQ